MRVANGHQLLYFRFKLIDSLSNLLRRMLHIWLCLCWLLRGDVHLTWSGPMTTIDMILWDLIIGFLGLQLIDAKVILDIFGP